MEDKCCWACRSQYGCTNNKCEHHVSVRRQQDADDLARRLYRDPTADRAVSNVMRARNG